MARANKLPPLRMLFCQHDHNNRKRPTRLVTKHFVLHRKDTATFAADLEERELEKPYCVLCLERPSR